MAELEGLLTYDLLSREELLELSRTAGFTQPQVVELFRWDLELVSQIQRQSKDFVLKGGAATQLYLAVEKQRGSVDVDLLFPPRTEALEQVVRALRERFASRAPFFQFEEYRPKSPTPNLPMKTYQVGLPSVLTDGCRIKLDVLLIETEVPFHTMRSSKTFAGTVENVVCSTPGALIGDKLLTLAKGTIGIQKVEDYPKQLYDLEMLAYQRDCGIEELTDAIKAVKILTPIEASFRDRRVEPTDALEDVKKTMTAFSSIDLASGDKQLKKAVNDFQQFYVSESQMGTKQYEWSCRILRMRFLASLIQLHFMDKLSPQEMERILSISKSISSRAKSAKAEEVEETRSRLLKLSKGPETKEMKWKPLDRVFWHTVTPENIEDLDKSI
jgi:hypothetical protein